MAHYSNTGQTVSYVDEQINRNQVQVNDLTNVMQQNLAKVMDRDMNLANLESSANELNNRANQFQTTSNKTKKRFIWKNRKWTIILVVTVIAILAIIALAIGLAVGLSQKK